MKRLLYLLLLVTITAYARDWGPPVYVSALYRVILGRTPDPGGYCGFVNAGLDIRSLAAGFINSDEFYLRYNPMVANLKSGTLRRIEYGQQFYRNAFGRRPENPKVLADDGQLVNYAVKIVRSKKFEAEVVRSLPLFDCSERRVRIIGEK